MRKILILTFLLIITATAAKAPVMDHRTALTSGRVYLKNGNFFDGGIETGLKGEVTVHLLGGSMEFAPEEVREIKYENGIRINWDVIRRLEAFDSGKEISPEQYENIIKRAAYLFGIDEKLIKAVIKQESNYFHMAVSPKGAMGLMQIMPQTARQLSINDPFDPVENIEGGARFLAYLMKKYGGSKHLALAAYNAGPEAVNRYGGVPPYEETRNYVRRVLAHYRELGESRD